MTYFSRDNRGGDSRRSFAPRSDFGGRREGGRGQMGGDRRMYPAVCADCGRDCEVPFFPDGSKPVYCSNCFEKSQGGNEYSRPSFGGRKFEEKKPNPQSQNQMNDLLVSINSKLGKILELMAPSEKTVIEPMEKKVKKKSKKVEIEPVEVEVEE